MKPISSERARAVYLESQIQGMDSVLLPLNTPVMEDGSHVSADLARRINIFCKEQKERKKTGTGICIDTSIECIKDKVKSRHPKQPDKEEREVVYSQIAQNMEKTRDVV